MKRLLTVALLAVTCAAVPSFGQATQPAFSDVVASANEYDLKTSEPKVTDADWEKYNATLDERAQKAVDGAKIADEAKARHVKASVIAWYKLTRAWHAQHDAKLKELKKDAKGNAAEITKVRESLKPFHDAFVADLASQLAPEGVDAIKEALTYGRPNIMATGFAKDNPWLSEAQKADIRKIANDSREAAMDEGSSDEKHKVMDQYKGRITNYIAAAKKAAATQPAK